MTKVVVIKMQLELKKPVMKQRLVAIDDYPKKTSFFTIITIHGESCLWQIYRLLTLFVNAPFSVCWSVGHHFLEPLSASTFSKLILKYRKKLVFSFLTHLIELVPGIPGFSGVILLTLKIFCKILSNIDMDSQTIWFTTTKLLTCLQLWSWM